MTKTSATALAGQGLMGVARDNYPRDGTPFSFVAGFAEVEVDVETGNYRHPRLPGGGRCGHRHPSAYSGGQVLGRSMLGIGHAIGQKRVYDQHYGVPLATRFYQNKPPTILDAPAKMRWAALNIPIRNAGRFARHRRTAGGGGLQCRAQCVATRSATSIPARTSDGERHPRIARSGHPACKTPTAHI